MHFLQAINSDISVPRVCNKTGGTIKGDEKVLDIYCSVHRNILWNNQKPLAT